MKLKSTPMPALLACGLTLALAPAFANERADEKFQKMDSNNDGKITRAEHTAGSQQMFSKLDTDRDGMVSTSELKAGWSEKKDDKNDRSSSSSARSGLPGDAHTVPPVPPVAPGMQPNVPGPRTSPADMADDSRRGTNPGGMNQDESAIAEKIREMDRNDDGQISKQEHMAAADKMFAKADANNDGSVSEKEFEEAHQEMKKELKKDKKKW